MNTSKSAAANPYLEGDYAPVDAEVTLTDLDVVGNVPEHLDGRYLRIGPNPIGDVDPATYNWFLGDGMVHGVRIRDGRAEWYRNRWVRSAGVSLALGEQRRPGPTGGGFDFAANTNVIGHAGKTFAIVESGATPFELTDELDTVGASDFGGTLKGGYTAHPKRDPRTGELHAVSYSPLWGNNLRYTVTGVDGRVRRTESIETTGAPMVHDFALTENHIVVFDLPVTLDLTGAGRIGKALGRLATKHAVPDVIANVARKGSATGKGGPPKIGLPYRWNPDYPARVGVLGRDAAASTIRWFDVEPCYVFHSLNAYESDDAIILDVVRHDRMFATEVRGPNEGPPTLDRWTIDLSANKVIEDRIDDRGQEFPRIDERRVGLRHRYGYTVAFGESGEEGRLVRHDLDSRTSLHREFGADNTLSEFVHVPSSGDATEDDGVIMGFVHNRVDEVTDLRILDSATLEDVGRIEIPVRVPSGFHGNWVSAL